MTDEIGENVSVVNYQQNEGNTVKVSENRDQIYWDILQSALDSEESNYTENEDGTITGTLAYTLHYTVKLDNLSMQNPDQGSVKVNDSAKLTYAVCTDGMWGDIPAGSGTARNFFRNVDCSVRIFVETASFLLVCPANYSWRFPVLV